MGAILSFILAGICLVISIFQFMEKGFCFNDEYLYASKEERKKMDMGPYYRQSAIVFLLLFFCFGIVGISAAFHIKWLLLPGIIVIVLAITYAFVSSTRINKFET